MGGGKNARVYLNITPVYTSGVDIYPIHGNESSLKNSDLIMDREICRLASIDIGTNSTHLLIAAIDPSLNAFSIDFAEKSTTRLGDRDSETGNLSDLSMNRVFETLKRFKEIAFSYKVTNLVIAATSAVREAPNGIFFLSQIKKILDLDVDLISGLEEARLIYLGVFSGMQFGNSPHFILDIGGGSTELILADSHDARALTSTKIGAVRLQREFIKSDPLGSENCGFLQSYIKGSLDSAIRKVSNRVQKGETPVMVATSGTALAIASLVASKEIISQPKLHGYKVKKNKLDKVIQELLLMNDEERSNLPSLSERRAEIIVPGALILQTAMEMLGVDHFVLSERALREGLVVDWMFRHGFLEDRFTFQSSIRQRTILHQAQRFSVDVPRAKRVAKYALIIYDKTSGLLHHDEGEGRDLLWAAAMLHSCGQHINLSAYHKHSWYLIKHGELLGYSHIEHLMVACIARYHRKSFPKKRHEPWQLLSNSFQRRLVSELSMILRLACAIDKRPEPVISTVNVKIKSSVINIELIPNKLGHDIELEKWNLKKAILNIRKNHNIDINVV